MQANPDDLLPFLCKSTGKCCIHNLVILSSFDIFRIAKALEVSAKKLFENKILTYRINPTNFWMEPILNSKANSTCPFLFSKSSGEDNKEYLCEIYEFRPLVCRIYPLKYDKSENLFLRFLPAENRCWECISNEKNPTLTEYLDNANIPNFLGEYTKYLKLIESIQVNLNLETIKKNKLAQEKFFKIQAILYETYPNQNEEKLPFDEMKFRIEEILE